MTRLALPLSFMVAAAAASAQVTAYHDQTLAQHQSQISSLVSQGYRPIALTSYGSSTNPLFAAVWERRSGTTFVPFSSVDGATYQNLFNTYTPLGLTVRLLTVQGNGSSTRFTGMFEVDPTPFWAAQDLTQSQFDAQCNTALTQGYIPTSVAVYGTSAAPRFAAVWARNDGKIDWTWAHSPTPTDYQLHFTAAAAGWLRPAITTLSSWGEYLSIWHDTQISGGWGASHDMTSAGYQAQVTSQGSAGNYPIDVHASGTGSATRFAAVFAPSRSVVARQWTATGTAVVGLSAFDAYVQNLMQTTNVRGASLSVVKDGRLMLTRGYTWAEPGYPVTQPTSLFRIASMTKPLTSIAIHQAMSRSRTVGAGSKVLSFFPPIVPSDPRTNDISLLNLLTHAGGWNIDTMGFDPQFHDLVIANFWGTTLPVSRDEIYRYMSTSRPLSFAPGSQSRYSNYGFMLLGRVLESLNPGMSYTHVMQRDVFAPLGVTRARLGGSTLGQAVAGEVRYHPKVPYVARSVMTSAQPWVPGQYGSWNMSNLDSHGGWIMASSDFAAVLASFALGDQSPLLDSYWSNVMWSPDPNLSANTLRGWFRTNAAGFRVLRHHNGGLPGTSTGGALRSDGVGFVLFLNRDSGVGDAQYLDLDQIANGITQWPGNDLFPSVGIPSLRTHVTGTFTSFGIGCPGSSGTPAHAGSGTPELGQTISLRTTSGPRNGVAVLILGASRVSWNGIRLPLSLAALGAGGCDLLASADLMLTQSLNFAGVGSTDIAIPASTALVSSHVYSQTAPVDLRANTLGLVFSNGLDTRVGGWQ